MSAMRVAVLLLLPFLSACGGTTPAGPDGAFLRFALRAPKPQSGDSVTAQAGRRQIAVLATLSGPDPCRTLEGELESRDGEVTLRVLIRPSGAAGCVQVVGRFAYAAVIEGLRPGRYHLQVVHTYPSTGWPTQAVLSETVDVRQ